MKKCLAEIEFVESLVFVCQLERGHSGRHVERAIRAHPRFDVPYSFFWTTRQRWYEGKKKAKTT